MASFRKWLEMSSLRDILKPVPQSPVHHAEGDVFAHTRMVRQQIEDAVNHLRELSADKDSVFGNLNANLSSQDKKLLMIGAWMHDIGKASATYIGKDSWPSLVQAGKQGDPQGKITAYRHEEPYHFEPMMRKLSPVWKKMYADASDQDKQDLWYIINNHMALKKDEKGQPHFGRRLMGEMLGPDGKYKDDRRTKLLLLLILMDHGGRIGPAGITGTTAMSGTGQQMSGAAIQHWKKAQQLQNKAQRKNTWDTPEEMVRNLRDKPLSTIRQALLGKFKRDFSDEEIQQMM